MSESLGLGNSTADREVDNSSTSNAVDSGSGANAPGAAGGTPTDRASGNLPDTTEDAPGLFGFTWDKISAFGINTGFGLIPVIGPMLSGFNLLAKGVDKLNGGNMITPGGSPPTVGSMLVEAAKGIARGDITPNTDPAFGSSDKQGSNEGGNIYSKDSIFSGSGLLDNTSVPSLTQASSQPAVPTSQPDSTLVSNPFAPKTGIFSTTGSIWF